MPLSVRMTISPGSPTFTGLPSGSTSSTSNSGLGLPMEPTFGVVPAKLPSTSVVSVWPKASMMDRPVVFLNRLNTSGFSASPAVHAVWMLLRSYLEMSSRIRKRYMVGGAQNVVMLYFANIGRMSWALKRSKSYTNTAHSFIHCPYSLPHSALPQPVSEIVKCRPSGSTLCQ